MVEADDDFALKATALAARARGHGVELLPGEPVLEVIKKLVDRLDQYRDKPESKGRILIE